jgi:hypothetical protein
MGTTKKGHPVNREALENAVYDAFPDLDMGDIERMDTDQLERLIELTRPKPAKPEPVKPSPPKVRESKKPAPPVVIAPRTIGEAFALVDGQLTRRTVARVEVVQRDGERFTREVEQLTPCGDRVRFGGRTYRAAVVTHYLKTGELVNRAPRAAKPPRYRARVRTPGGLVHLGYFGSVEEREAAIFAYKLGIFPNGSK